LINSRAQRRWFNFAGVGIVVGLLGYAFFAQYVQGYNPCPLCWFQRFALLPVAAVFLVAGLHAPAGWGARVYAVLGVVTAALGAFTAGWHIYVQYTPNPPACLGDLAIVFEYNPFFEAIQRVFENAGDCTEIDWSFLGLSMPTWVLLWFLALGVLAVHNNWKRL
jgi:disulfide bond formation protein DsbB